MVEVLSSEESTLNSQLGGLVWGKHKGGQDCSAPLLYVASTQPP